MKRYLTHTEEIASFIPIFAYKKINNGFKLCTIENDMPFIDGLYEDFCLIEYTISSLADIFLNLKRDYDAKIERSFSIIDKFSDKTPEEGEVAFQNIVNCYIYFTSKKFDNWPDVIFNDSQVGKTALVQSNILRVYHFAHLYKEQTDLWDDMVQNGVLGIIQAIDTFLPWYGHRFGTYATWMIRGALQRHLRNENKFLRFNNIEIDNDPESGITLEHLPLNKDSLFYTRREQLARKIRQILEEQVIHQLEDEEKAVLLSDLDNKIIDINNRKRVNEIRRKIKYILFNNSEFRKLREELLSIDDIEETIEIL